MSKMVFRSKIEQAIPELEPLKVIDRRRLGKFPGPTSSLKLTGSHLKEKVGQISRSNLLQVGEGWSM